MNGERVWDLTLSISFSVAIACLFDINSYIAIGLGAALLGILTALREIKHEG